MKYISQKSKYRKLRICQKHGLNSNSKKIHEPHSSEVSPDVDKELLFKNLLNTLTDTCVFVIDASWLIVYCNDSFQKLLESNGWHDAPLGRKLNATLPFVNKAFVNELNESFQAHLPARFKHIYFQDGDEYNAIVIIKPMYSHEGNILLSIVIKDITSLSKLVSRSEWLSASLDQSSDYYSVKDLNHRYIAANSAFAIGAGYNNPEDIKGKSEEDLFPESPKPTGNEKKGEELYPGHCLQKEKVFLHSDGRKKHVLENRFPIFDSNGDVSAVANFTHDITALKREQERLERSENQFRTLVENQDEGICILDDQNRFYYANQASSSMFGIDLTKRKDSSISSFLNKSNQAKIRLEFQFLNEHSSRSFELKFKLNNGLNKHFFVTATLYSDDEIKNGKFIVLRDITDEKNAEKDLRRSEKQLKQLNATKDKFFSIIAHDLKNPFGSIMGFSNLILRKIKHNDIDKIEEYAKIIRKASANGFELLENLLEWSRSQSGALQPAPSKVSVTELIGHNLEVCRGYAESKSIYLSSTKHPDYLAFVDEDMINTVIRNLLNNAIKFTPEGKSVTIAVNKKNNGFIALSIIDEGIGIEKRFLKNLFKMQHHHSTTGTNGEEGTGLGLLLCKEFVEKNGGKIQAQSILNQGSTFTFTMPVFND